MEVPFGSGSDLKCHTHFSLDSRGLGETREEFLIPIMQETSKSPRYSCGVTQICMKLSQHVSFVSYLASFASIENHINDVMLTGSVSISIGKGAITGLISLPQQAYAVGGTLPVKVCC